MEMSWPTMLLMACAAIVATVLRLYDPPKIELTLANAKTIVETFIGCAVVAPIVAWFLADTAGIYIDSWEGFMAVVILAVGGISTLKGLVEGIKSKIPTGS